MKETDVTILIPSLDPDRNELTRRALLYCELSLLETFSGQYKVLYNGEGTDYPQGQCAAVNRGAKEVTTPWIMILNNDMILPPGWFERLTREVDSHKFLVASPNLVEPRKGAPPFLQKFCGGVGTLDGPADFDKQCFMEFAANHQEHINRPDLSVEDGFNMPVLIRTDVFREVGMYDEAYDPWGSNSDSDLQYRLMIAGIVPKRVRNAVVYHFSQTSGTFHPSHRDAWEKNQRYFREKFGVERASSPDIWYKPSLEGVTYHPGYENRYR